MTWPPKIPTPRSHRNSAFCSPTSSIRSINNSSRQRRSPLSKAQNVNMDVTVPAWKLLAILMLTLSLSVSLREFMPVTMSQNQLNLIFRDLGNFSLTTLSTSSTAQSTSDGTTITTTNAPLLLVAEEGTNRSILMVHVGKAGGSTLRKAAKVICKTVKDPIDRRRPPLERSCSGKNSPVPSLVPLTGRLILDVYHLWGFNETLPPLVTTYLVTIRNPIERIVSTYRYENSSRIDETHNKSLLSSYLTCPPFCHT